MSKFKDIIWKDNVSVHCETQEQYYLLAVEFDRVKGRFLFNGCNKWRVYEETTMVCLSDEMYGNIRRNRLNRIIVSFEDVYRTNKYLSKLKKVKDEA